MFVSSNYIGGIVRKTDGKASKKANDFEVYGELKVSVLELSGEKRHNIANEWRIGTDGTDLST